jgi:hypothetical protein
MKSSKDMQQIIGMLAAKHAVDLTEIGAALTLYNPPYMRLAIECIGRNLVSVAHYYELNGDLCQDPDVVFFTGYTEWVPVQFQNAYMFGDWATVSDDGTKITHLARHMQDDLGSFSDDWANEIREAGWLEHGTRDRDEVIESQAA